MWRASLLCRGGGKVTACAALVASVCFSVGVGPAGGAAVAGTGISLTMPGGGRASVFVFYVGAGVPDRRGARFTLPLMAEGTATAGGTVSLGLDTASVRSRELGTDSTGRADEFDGVLVAVEPSGRASVQERVLRLGSWTDVSVAQATFASHAVADPAGGDTPSLSADVVSTQYHFTPVLAWNNADGMTSTFTYSFSQSSSRQTQVQGAVYQGGGWSVGPYVLEQQDRTISAAPTVTTGFHYYEWADYYYVEYLFVLCNKGYCVSWDQWQPDHWTGNLTDSNPNKSPAGKVIGVVPYAVPAFPPANVNWYFPLKPRSGTFIRSTGQIQSYGFTFDAGQWLSIDAVATYDTETSVSWTALAAGCPQPAYTDYIWGATGDPGSVPIVQADCTPTVPIA